MKDAYTEPEMQEMGNRLAKILKMKRDREYKDRWQTEWGTKTGLGLFRTITAVIQEVNMGNPKRLSEK